MIDEQQINDELEHLAGGVDRAFRLMRLAREAAQKVSGDRFSISPPNRTQESVFTSFAKREGYTEDAIRFYVKHFL